MMKFTEELLHMYNIGHKHGRTIGMIIGFGISAIICVVLITFLM